MKVSLQRLLKKEVDNLIAFSRNFLLYKRYVLLLGIISLFYISVILFYTHGALLFDGDNSGFYHFSLSLLETPTGILTALSLFLSFGNIYAAFYIYLYLSLFIGILASFYLSLQILNNFIPREKLLILSLLSSALFPITPFILIDYYNSFIGNVALSTSLFTFFLAFLFRSYSSQSNQQRFLDSILLSGVFLGLSVTPYPNDVRMMIVGYLFFFSIIIFFIISSFFSNWKVAIIRISQSTGLFIVTSVLFSLFQTYSIFKDIPAFLHESSIAAPNYTYLGFYTGSFNTIPQVIRLLGIWAFPTGYVIYHNIYYGINIVNISSYFWPLLALLLPLILAYRIKKNRGLLLFIMTLVLLSIFWEKGANPPFGSIWYFINNRLPMGYQLIPTGTLDGTFLVKMYPLLSTLSIVSIYIFLKGEGRFNIKKGPSLRKKLGKLAILVPVALIIILVVAEMPVFDGQLEENFFNEKTSGFFLPEQYNYARDYLLNFQGGVLLLPGVQTYITTSWNYDGSSYIYNSFFQPVNIVDIQTFGGGYASSGQANVYLSLVSPISIEKNSTTIEGTWLHDILEYNITYILYDTSIISGYDYNYTYYDNAISFLLQNHMISIELTLGNLTIYRVDLPLNQSEK